MNTLNFLLLSFYFIFQCTLSHASSRQEIFQDRPMLEFQLNFKMHIYISEDWCTKEMLWGGTGCNQLKKVGTFPVSSYPEHVYLHYSPEYREHNGYTVVQTLQLYNYKNDLINLNFQGHPSNPPKEVALFNGKTDFNFWAPRELHPWLRYFKKIPSFDFNKPTYARVWEDHYDYLIGYGDYQNFNSYAFYGWQSSGVKNGNFRNWPEPSERHMRFETLSTKDLFENSATLIDAPFVNYMGDESKVRRIQLKLELDSWKECDSKHFYYFVTQSCRKLKSYEHLLR